MTCTSISSGSPRSRAWWVDPGPDVRQALIGASHRLGDANAEDPRVVAVHAYSDPWDHAAGVLARLKRAARDERLDADAARFFGPAALVVGAFDLGNDFLEAAVDGLRTEGRLGHLPRLLMLHACMAARLGDWDVALTAADEARRLAEEFADPQVAAAADTAFALVAAMRGDEQTAELHGRTGRDGRGAGGRQHHDGVRPVREGAGRARRRPPRRRVRIR